MMDDWAEFQEKVAEFFRSVPNCTVFVNHPITGSRGTVNVDVFLVIKADREPFAARVPTFEFTVIVECKCWKTRVPQEKVFALKTVVEDTGAALGILVTEKGVQKGAAAFLQRPVNVKAMTFAELQAELTEGMHLVYCFDCRKQALVPFRPTIGKPIFCRDCYSQKRSL